MIATLTFTTVAVTDLDTTETAYASDVVGELQRISQRKAKGPQGDEIVRWYVFIPHSTDLSALPRTATATDGTTKYTVANVHVYDTHQEVRLRRRV